MPLQAYLLRGVAQLRRQQFRKAGRDLNKFLSAVPDKYVRTCATRTVCLAASFSRHVLPGSDCSLLGLYNSAVALCAMGEVDAAMARLDRAVDVCMVSQRIHYPFIFQARAMLLRRKGQFLKANQDYITAHNLLEQCRAKGMHRPSSPVRTRACMHWDVHTTHTHTHTHIHVTRIT